MLCLSAQIGGVDARGLDLYDMPNQPALKRLGSNFNMKLQRQASALERECLFAAKVGASKADGARGQIKHLAMPVQDGRNDA